MNRYKSSERAKLLGEFVVETGATVRHTASVYGISKSTVHKDITTTLKKVNKALYDKIEEILQRNKSERHIRGGEATRQKYLRQKHNINT